MRCDIVRCESEIKLKMRCERAGVSKSSLLLFYLSFFLQISYK